MSVVIAQHPTRPVQLRENCAAFLNTNTFNLICILFYVYLSEKPSKIIILNKSNKRSILLILHKSTLQQTLIYSYSYLMSYNTKTNNKIISWTKIKSVRNGHFILYDVPLIVISSRTSPLFCTLVWKEMTKGRLKFID